MRAITIMFDSLNRKMLSAYGSEESITPNFKRLSERCVTFDTCYVGSLPCMPARRELHTGRYNFLHRDWTPLEPFDDSIPQMLSDNRVYTHFVSDHAHYWQEGGVHYHTKFSSYEMIRGQEGDWWKGKAEGFEHNLDTRRQDGINRPFMEPEENHPHVRGFNAGMEFLKENIDADNWYLHLEYFDPHEPFFAPEQYRRMYDEQLYDFDWPANTMTPDEETTRASRINYLALVTMCDTYLGKVLDFMDENEMWKDTLLIVNTDHGFLLGEHDYYGKNYMPVYEELSHTPLFIWDPRSGIRGERRDSLVQTIDIGPTLLDYFGIETTDRMHGKSLLPVIRENRKIRDYALFGYFGKHVNITDGRYVYMRSGQTVPQPLNNYTLSPCRIFSQFTVEELRQTDRELVTDFSFTQGVPVMKIPVEEPEYSKDGPYTSHMQFGDLLFDLATDPNQQHPLNDAELIAHFQKEMKQLMEYNEAPAEQYERLGLLHL